MQAPHADHAPPTQVRVCVPQRPQGCDEAPGHVVGQAPHVQVEEQVWALPSGHVRDVPGAHAPSLVQALQGDHAPPAQVRVCVPQRPQDWLEAPEHIVGQGLQVQAAEQVWPPPVLHARVLPGAHAPSPVQGPHADQR